MANQTTTGSVQGPAIFSSFADDPDMKELVDLFVGEMSERISQLRIMDSACDLIQLQRLAHQLKGAGGGYGFPAITEAASRLEANVKEGEDSGQIEMAISELAALCDRATAGHRRVESAAADRLDREYAT